MLEATATLLAVEVEVLVVVEETILLQNKETTLEELGLTGKFLCTFTKIRSTA
jgi:hypothetical protein